jgi:hypothetical protein
MHRHLIEMNWCLENFLEIALHQYDTKCNLTYIAYYFIIFINNLLLITFRPTV